MQTARGAAVVRTGDPGQARRNGPRLAVVLTAVVVLVADVVSKIEVVAHLRPDDPVDVIGTFLRLDLTRNPGAAFSIGTGSTIVFTVVALAVVAVIARTARSLVSTGWGLALGLLLGGALGNLSDRIFRAPAVFRGHVVDWIELPHWPVFNIADSAITVGAILAVLLSLTGRRLVPDRTDDETGQEPQ